MKVGILTHHWLYNFGANLQALATQECLKSLGHEPVIVNYRPPELVKRYDSLVSSPQIDSHCQFRDEHLIETEICSNLAEVIEAATNANVEVMLSGSDAVLRLNVATDREDLNFPNPFWLDWAVEREMKTGFLAASSMGSNYFSLSSSTRKDIGRLLNDIDYLGVRDNWTKFMLSICNRGADLRFCPDPVSVFNDVVPAELIPPPSDEDYILLSLYKNTLGHDWIKQFVECANSNGLKVFSLPHPELEVEGPFNEVLRLPMSPLQWYAWLKHAKGYVGVRFHPIMISLVNEVPFVALDQYESGLRFQNRIFSKAASLLALPWRRNTSKTYDVTKRANKSKFCFNPRMYKRLSPESVFGLLQEQMQQSGQGNFPATASQLFKDVLRQLTT